MNLSRSLNNLEVCPVIRNQNLACQYKQSERAKYVQQSERPSLSSNENPFRSLYIKSFVDSCKASICLAFQGKVCYLISGNHSFVGSLAKWTNDESQHNDYIAEGSLFSLSLLHLWVVVMPLSISSWKMQGNLLCLHVNTWLFRREPWEDFPEFSLFLSHHHPCSSHHIIISLVF